MSIQLSKHYGRLSIRLDLRLWEREPAPVELLVTPAGLEIRRAGSRKRRVITDWNAVLRHATLPPDAPTKYLSNPAGLIADKA